MSKAAKIILIVCICIFVFVIGVIGVAFFATYTAKNADNYKIGENSVPSIKTVIGERKITKVSSESISGVKIKEYDYVDISSTFDDLVSYVDELKNNQGFTITKSFNLNDKTGSLQLAKDAVESGKLFIVEISWTENSYKVLVGVSEGTLTLY